MKRLRVKAQGRIVYALVDDQDADRLREWSWSLTGRGYAMGSPGLMHRVVMGLSKGDPEIDHINRDKLDNRRRNLRLSTRTENNLNSARSDRCARLRAEVRRLRTEGATRAQIAETLSVSLAFVGAELRGDTDWHLRRGTGPVSDRAMTFLAEEHSFSEVRDACGIDSNHTGVLLNRLRKYGLIERVSHGRYRLAETSPTDMVAAPRTVRADPSERDRAQASADVSQSEGGPVRSPQQLAMEVAT